VGIVVRRDGELLFVRRAGTHGSGTRSFPEDGLPEPLFPPLQNLLSRRTVA